MWRKGSLSTAVLVLSVCLPALVVSAAGPSSAHPTSTPTLLSADLTTVADGCLGTCWRYDVSARTLTWTGPVDGREDVWEGDVVSLDRVRQGWTALFGPMTVPGEIEACVLTLNGQVIKQTCDGLKYPVPQGQVLEVTSAHPTAGGFRWIPAGGYGYRSLYDLQVTPPADVAYFELPFWVVPGGSRQINVSTAWTYNCYTNRNPLTDVIQLTSDQCTLVLRDYVHKGSANAVEWGRNYNGSFTLHTVAAFGADRLISINGGENKNEYLNDRCYQNTINTDVACATCASGYHDGTYADCWPAYNGLINLSWQYYDAAHNWGLQLHQDEGPIVWPANGYTYGGVKSSQGVRHPHGIVTRGYIWVFYEDKSYAYGDLGYGIRVARADESSGGLPGNWQTYCHGSWVPALPPGFNRQDMQAFYAQRGGCASPVLPTGGWQFSFAVAENLAGGYLGIEEHADDAGVWELRLWTSSDLLEWRLLRRLLPTHGGWAGGELHYPVFLANDGWHSDRVDERDFYIIGTRQGTLRALHVRTTQVYLPLLLRGTHVAGSPAQEPR